MYISLNEKRIAIIRIIVDISYLKDEYLCYKRVMKEPLRIENEKRKIICKANHVCNVNKFFTYVEII